MMTFKSQMVYYTGGVGVFYKETLQIRIYTDSSFSECVVTELSFGRKYIFSPYSIEKLSTML